MKTNNILMARDNRAKLFVRVEDRKDQTVLNNRQHQSNLEVQKVKPCPSD